MPLSQEKWELEGVDLADFGVSTIETRDGWDVQVGRRGEPLAIPYRHGAFTIPRKYMDANAFSLTITVLDREPDGSENPGGIYVGLQENMDLIKGLLYSATLLDLRRTMADTIVRQAVVEMIAATPWTQRAYSAMNMQALFINSEATWRELPKAEELGIAAAGILNVGGNAPVGDSVWTITQGASSGGSTIEVSGTTVEIATLTAGDELTIDNGNRRTWTDFGNPGQLPADAITKFSRANWIELVEAQANAVTLTGDITADVNWYNRWL